MTSALGSGDAFKSKINSALEAQGLEEATNAAAQGRQRASTPTRMVSDAPSDSPYFMDLTLTMPYSKAQFEAQHVKYTAAVASAASAPVSNVEIVSVTEKPNGGGQLEVDVETKVRAKD